MDARLYNTILTFDIFCFLFYALFANIIIQGDPDGWLSGLLLFNGSVGQDKHITRYPYISKFLYMLGYDLNFLQHFVIINSCTRFLFSSLTAYEFVIYIYIQPNG